MNKICSLNLGTALLVSSVFSPAQIVLAQSCTIPPTCESLGYDKNPSDCVDKAILKCPLDKTKIFALTAWPTVLLLMTEIILLWLVLSLILTDHGRLNLSLTKYLSALYLIYPV